jgi:ADP-ribose pyrophosphatase YjhB (NUDIX family)
MRVRALVQRQNKTVLAIPDPENNEHFVIPGGDVAEGETPEQACERHLREQTGLKMTAAVYLFEDEEDGDTTVAYDIEYEVPRHRRYREQVSEDAKFVGPVHITAGRQGEYNHKLMDLCGIDWTDIVDDVMTS